MKYAFMPHALATHSLVDLKSWAIQHCRNALQDMILHHAPGRYQWEDCDFVVEFMLAQFRRMIAHLSVERLQNVRYMNCLIHQIIADGMKFMRFYRGAGWAHE
jgi:hypothetical protein